MERFDFGASARAALAREVQGRLSPRRFAHTRGVEETAAAMAALYCPEKEGMLRAAALLHDVTKELSVEEQKKILDRHTVTLRADEEAAPEVLHGITAALIIPEEFPAFAAPEVISAVRRHTTGCAGMSLTDAIVCLADTIESGRTYPACVALRERFFGAHPEHMCPPDRTKLLAAVLWESLSGTLNALAARGKPVSLDTEATVRWLENENNPFWRKSYGI